MVRMIVVYAFLLLVIALIGEAQAESRFKIAILDTGISHVSKFKPYLCKTGHRSTVSTNLEDKHGHGTNIAGLIAKNLDPKKHCLVIIKVFDFSKGYQVGDTSEFVSGLIHAIRLGVDAINLSTNSGTHSSDEEYYAMMLALSKGIKIVLSAGNRGKNLDKTKLYPVSYNFRQYTKDIYIVGSPDGDYSNTGSVVKYWVSGTKKGYKKLTGTSQSAAIFTGLLAKQLGR